MTVKYSTGLDNALLDGSGSGLAAFNSGQLKLYSGSEPATADAAATGTVVASFSLAATAFAAAASKARALLGVPLSVAASATGTPGYFRFLTSSDDGTLSTTQKRIQGSVGQGSGDISLDNTTIVSGQTVTITSYSAGLA